MISLYALLIGLPSTFYSAIRRTVRISSWGDGGKMISSMELGLRRIFPQTARGGSCAAVRSWPSCCPPCSGVV